MTKFGIGLGVWLCMNVSGLALAQDLRAQCTSQVASEVLRDIYAPELRANPALAQVFADPNSAPVKAAVNDCQAGREGGGRAGMDRWIRQPQARAWYWQNLIQPAAFNPAEAQRAITQTYVQAFGRQPTQPEIDFWLKDPRARDPAQVLEVHRGRLKQGIEVDETIARSYAEAWKRAPTADELRFWKSEITAKGLLHADVVNQHREYLRANPAMSPERQAECTPENARRALATAFASYTARYPALLQGFGDPLNSAVLAAVNDCKAGREGGGAQGMLAWVSRPDTNRWYWENLGLRGLAMSSECTSAQAQRVLEEVFANEVRKTSGTMSRLFADPTSLVNKAAVNDCMAGREGGGAAGMRQWVGRPDTRNWYLANLIQPGRKYVSDVQVSAPQRSGQQEVRKVRIRASSFTPLAVKLTFQPRAGGAAQTMVLGSDFWTGVEGWHTFDLTLRRIEPLLGNINTMDYNFWFEASCEGCAGYRSITFGVAEDEIRAAEAARKQAERDQFCKANASLLLAYDGTEVDETARSSIWHLWNRFSGIGGCPMLKLYMHGPSMLGGRTSTSGTGGGELACRDFECNYLAIFQEACKADVVREYPKVFVIGFSRGGMNAIRFANEFPGACARGRPLTFLGVIDPVDTMMSGNFNAHKSLNARVATSSLKVVKRNQWEHFLTTHPTPGFMEQRVINIPEHPDETDRGGHWSMNTSSCKSGRWSEDQLAGQMQQMGVEFGPKGAAGQERCRK